MKNQALVVSSEIAFRESIGEILAPNGYDVLCAATGRMALRMMRENIVNVIILDYQTPYDSKKGRSRDSKPIEAITDASPFLPLVLIHDATEKLNHATLLMADIRLTHPIEAAVLLNALDTVLGETLQDRVYRKAADIAVMRSFAP